MGQADPAAMVAAGLDEVALDSAGSPTTAASELSRRSWLRRALTVAGTGAVAALTGGLHPRPVAAATGDSIKAGQQTNAEGSTVLYADGTTYGHGYLAVTDTAFGSWPSDFPADSGITGFGQNRGTGVAGLGTDHGVFGYSSDGAGVQGFSAYGAGVSASGYVGVGLLASTSDTIYASPAIKALAGGSGEAIAATNNALASAPTIRATSSAAAPAVLATGRAVAANGTSVQLAGNAAALAVQGAASFTRSGIATIGSGVTSATVKVAGGLATSSHVLATMQTKLTTTPQVVAAVPSASKGTITIYLSAAPSSTVHVAWFVFG